MDTLPARPGRQPGGPRHGRRPAAPVPVDERTGVDAVARDGLEHQHARDGPRAPLCHRQPGAGEPGGPRVAARRVVPGGPRRVQRPAAVGRAHPPMGLARVETLLVHHPARRRAAEPPETPRRPRRRRLRDARVPGAGLAAGCADGRDPPHLRGHGADERDPLHGRHARPLGPARRGRARHGRRCRHGQAAVDHAEDLPRHHRRLHPLEGDARRHGAGRPRPRAEHRHRRAVDRRPHRRAERRRPRLRIRKGAVGDPLPVRPGRPGRRRHQDGGEPVERHDDRRRRRGAAREPASAGRHRRPHRRGPLDAAKGLHRAPVVRMERCVRDRRPRVDVGRGPRDRTARARQGTGPAVALPAAPVRVRP